MPRSLPGLERQVVGEVRFTIQQRLLVALSLNQLALSQPEAPLLHVDNHRIRQVALHDKQRTENNLQQTNEQTHLLNRANGTNGKHLEGSITM